MKHILKMLLVVLAAGTCGMLIFLWARTPNRPEVKRTSLVPPVREESRSASIPTPVPTNTLPIVKPAPSVTNFAVPLVAQSVFTPALPTGVVYKPIISINRSGVLLPILSAASNAVLSVDGILKSKKYTDVKQFNRTVWLESEDRAQSTVWRISPYGTNAVVGGIKAIVYQDDSLTQRDPARSFQMEFYPDTGCLREFWWDDKHEIIHVQTNGLSGEYAKNLGDNKWLEMRWDNKGNLVSSNVYNWAKRGRVIGGAQPVAKPYRFGPTSAVEAATESWRHKQE